MQEGKPVKQFDPGFMIVSLPFGHNPKANYSIMKRCDFGLSSKGKPTVIPHL